MRLLASNLALTRTYLRWALMALCVYTVLYGVTQWIEAGRGISASEAGLLLLPMSAVSALMMGPISRRNLVRGPLLAGAAASLAGAAGVLFLTTGTPVIWIVIITLAFGVALGAAASGSQTALYTQVTAGQLGTASGLFRTFGYVGSIASGAIISIIFRSSASDHGLHVIGIIIIAASAVTLLITLADRKLRAQPDGAAARRPPADRDGAAARWQPADRDEHPSDRKENS